MRRSEGKTIGYGEEVQQVKGLVLIVVAPPVGETMGKMAVFVGMESVSE